MRYLFYKPDIVCLAFVPFFALAASPFTASKLLAWSVPSNIAEKEPQPSPEYCQGAISSVANFLRFFTDSPPILIDAGPTSQVLSSIFSPLFDHDFVSSNDQSFRTLVTKVFSSGPFDFALLKMFFSIIHLFELEPNQRVELCGSPGVSHTIN
jgi:hypothetical protein